MTGVPVAPEPSGLVEARSKLVGIQVKRTLREPVAAFFTLAFAPLLALILGLIFGNDPDPEFGGRGYLDANLVSFTAFVAAILGLVLVPTDLVSQRQSGALRRFRATPLRPGAYIVADVAVRFVLAYVGVVLMLLIGLLGFGVQLDGSLPGVLAAAALGLAAFLAVGYALAGVVRSVGVAQAVGNVAVYPLILLSGAAVPLAVLPDEVRDVARFSPLTQLVELLQDLWSGAGWSDVWVPLTVLAGLLAVAIVVATRTFRWE